jgi:hypothetical protein
MRNQQRTMTADERRTAMAARDALVRAGAGTLVRFTYTKDNGETSTREGCHDGNGFVGAESKSAIMLATSDGVRTFNLRNMTDVREA